MKARLKEFWKQNETKIILAAGLILVATISFEFGLIQGKKWTSSPLVIEKPVLGQNQSSEAAQGSTPAAQNLPSEAKIASISSSIPPANCAFVGSKNSNKYHLPTCQWAKRIKPENLVCFKSAEDAKTKGYQPDKNCVK